MKGPDRTAMPPTLRHCFTAILTALLLQLSGLAAERIPLENFLKDPAFDEIRLSPDGTRLAALARWHGHLQLFVLDIATAKSRQITGYDAVDVDSVSWRDDKTLSYTTIDEHRYTGRWQLAAADGTRITEDLTAWRAMGTLTSSHAHPDDHFVGEYSRPEDAFFVYSYNDVRKARTLIDKIPQAWIAFADLKEEFRIAVGGLQQEVAEKKGPDAKFERFVLARSSREAPWRKVFEYRADQCKFNIIGFAPDNRLVYVETDYGRGTEALVLFDPERGEIVQELLSDPLYDIGAPHFARDRKTLLGYDIVREHRETVWFDPQLKRIQELIDRQMPDNENLFVSMSEDRSRIVLLSRNDRNPGTYYLVDAKTLKLQTLIERRPWLQSKDLAPMKPILYKARDGVSIHGYLTLPLDTPPSKLPLVIMPHGGPWVRDVQEYDMTVQFLANRGYAVLQMNFRGSTGYGRPFLNLGVGEWGLKMQDDVTDGVKWAIAEGIADPQRIAIYGVSYGGFAALAGLATTPELYCCGVSYVGVTDIELMLKTSVPWELQDPGINLKLISNSKYDVEKYRQVSPLRMAERIKAPVFLAYGERDRRVNFKHGTRMAAALRKRDVPVEWMIRSQEGHGYREYQNQLDYYRTLEAFLTKYMGPTH